MSYMRLNSASHNTLVVLTMGSTSLLLLILFTCKIFSWVWKRRSLDLVRSHFLHKFLLYNGYLANNETDYCFVSTVEINVGIMVANGNHCAQVLYYIPFFIVPSINT